MKYNNLGKAGIKVSEISLGSWLTFGNQLDAEGVKQTMRTAYEHGVNFFDNAEAYANGLSESLMGDGTKRISSRRSCYFNKNILGVEKVLTI